MLEEASAAAKPQVYVIASPDLRKSKAWPKLEPVVRAKARNASLAMFEDVFPGGGKDYAENWLTRAPALAGAIVVPCRKGGALWLGLRAVAEAGHLTELGKPVFLLAAKGLLPWSAVQLDRPDRHPPFLPVRVVLG